MKDFNKLGLDRSGHPELFRKEAVLKLFGKYPGAHPHWSAILQKLYSTTNVFPEFFDNSQIKFVNYLWGAASALAKMGLREIFQCNTAEYSQN